MLLTDGAPVIGGLPKETDEQLKVGDRESFSEKDVEFHEHFALLNFIAVHT
jgi:hypothetical protein